MNLYDAVKVGNLAKIKELLDQGANPNVPVHSSKGHYTETLYPLIKAVQQGDLQIVNLLIDMGANVNVKTQGDGQTALHSAFLIDSVLPHKLSDAERKALRNEMVKYLVRKGADVNAEGGFCLTPLHQAVYQQNVDSVKFLIQHGANVNLVLGDVDENESRSTALGAAVQINHAELVKLLIEHDANPEAGRDCGLITPLEEALEIGNKEIIHLLVSPK